MLDRYSPNPAEADKFRMERPGLRRITKVRPDVAVVLVQELIAHSKRVMPSPTSEQRDVPAVAKS